MGVTYVRSADDEYIISIQQPWTWDEYNRVVSELMPLIRDSGRPTATIVDVLQMKTMPKGDVLGNLQRVEAIMPDNVFASAVVGAPYIAEVFMNILMKIRPKAKRIALFAKTIEDARAEIAERRLELER